MAMLERPAEVNHDIRVFARGCFSGTGPRANGRGAPKKPRKTAPETTT
jgi:hypothetical protein